MTNEKELEFLENPFNIILAIAAFATPGAFLAFLVGSAKNYVSGTTEVLLKISLSALFLV